MFKKKKIIHCGQVDEFPKPRPGPVIIKKRPKPAPLGTNFTIKKQNSSSNMSIKNFFSNTFED